MEDIKEYWENTLEDGEVLARSLGFRGLFTIPDENSPTGQTVLLHILDYFKDIKRPTKAEIQGFIRDYSKI